MLDVNFNDATALFIYLVPEGLRKLKRRLIDALERGVRIVTYGLSSLVYNITMTASFDIL